MVKLNTAVWEIDIINGIDEWKEFAESVFCETEEEKEAARDIVEKLCQTLEDMQANDGIISDWQWDLLKMSL